MFNIKDKKVVIIGAGKLSFSVVKMLAEYNCNIALCDKDLSKAEKIAKKVNSDKIITIEMDSGNVDSCNKSFENIIRNFFHIDVLINMVGGNKEIPNIELGKEIKQKDIDSIQEIIKLNTIDGMILPIKVLEKYISCNSNQLSIINMASVGAKIPLSDMSIFSMSKASILNYTKWLACEYAKKFGDKIRVNTIIPGFIVSKKNRFMYFDIENNKLTIRGDKILKSIPMGRFGNEEDILSTIIWLISDSSKYITGNTIYIDGGYSINSQV